MNLGEDEKRSNWRKRQEGSKSHNRAFGLYSIDQGVAICSPQVNLSPKPIFINKVLLVHSHVQSVRGVAMAAFTLQWQSWRVVIEMVCRYTRRFRLCLQEKHEILPSCQSLLSFFFYYYYYFNFILFLNFTTLYWFCQISKWIHHWYTCVPHPEPSSLLLPHTIPLGHPSATSPKHPVSCIKPSSQSNSHIHTWPQEKP